MPRLFMSPSSRKNELLKGSKSYYLVHVDIPSGVCADLNNFDFIHLVSVSF